MKYVIIGGVAGGATAAARLRRLDEHAEIVVLERSGYVSYANCGLPYYIGGEIAQASALTLQTPASFASRFRVEVRVRHEAVALHPENKTVTVRRLEDGSLYEEHYDKLLLAPGARPVRPPFPGAEDPRIFTLRTVEDTLTIRNFVEKTPPRRAVVVGAGFVGLEMAENLARLGTQVTVVERLNQVLASLDYDMACGVHRYLRSQGIRLLLGRSVRGFEKAGDALHVLLEGEEPLAADMVLLALGVAPENTLAQDAGLALGVRGAIAVNPRMETSIPDIYAVGDAVEVTQLETGAPMLLPLAGPANKQGRIAADNMAGGNSRFPGVQGTSILKLFDMAVASTGLNENAAKAAGVSFDRVVTFSANHATYYPGASNMTIKTLFDPATGKLLGAQIVGFAGVDKRIDVLATAIRAGMTTAGLTELELAYAPPFSSAKDPVNMAGYVAENLRQGLVKQHHWQDVLALPKDGSVTLLDVRTPMEYAGGHIPGTVHIPLDSLREHLSELDPSKPIYVNCQSGLRSYLACRILSQHGFICSNLSGGYRFYELVTGDEGFDASPAHDCGLPLSGNKN